MKVFRCYIALLFLILLMKHLSMSISIYRIIFVILLLPSAMITHAQNFTPKNQQDSSISTPHSATNPLAYIRTGDKESKYRVIFIHGSPGEKEAYDEYLNDLTLMKKAELISIDRLGYGDSGDKVEPSLIAQAQSILPFLDKNKKNILVGHSLGSPIALQMALLEAQHIAGVLLIASAFDPKLEQPKWYNYLANTLLLQWILPSDMNNSNKEMMVLSKQLDLLKQQDWSELTMPIRILHGEDDGLAAPDNAQFAYSKLNKSNARLRYVKDEGHLILWQNVPEVVKEINNLLGRVDQ